MAVSLIFCAYTALVVTKPISQDEGVFLAIGKFISQGSGLYQDFFDHKPPAIHWLFAGVFKLFGTNLWVAKAALLGSILGAAVCLKKISDSLKSGIGWYAVGIFLFLMTQFEGYYLIAEPFLLLPLLIAILIVLRHSQSPAWIFTAGVCLGFSLLFKQSVLVSLFPIMILVTIKSKKQLIPLLLGLGLPWLVTAAYLFRQGALDEAWHQVVILTLTAYPNEPLGYVLRKLGHNFLWTLPIWGLLFLAGWISLKHKTIVWALVLLPLPLMFYRHYPHYWIQLLPWVAILAASVLDDIRVRTVTVATLVFCIAIAGGKVGQDVGRNYQKLQAQFKVARELREEPADAVLAESQFTAFYFLLPQPPLNKYLYLTEITEAEKAQTKTIHGLQSHQNVLILWPSHGRSYAQDVQQYFLEHVNEEKSYPDLGMRVFLGQAEKDRPAGEARGTISQ